VLEPAQQQQQDLLSPARQGLPSPLFCFLFSLCCGSLPILQRRKKPDDAF
jgi:hypothetical protein